MEMNRCAAAADAEDLDAAMSSACLQKDGESMLLGSCDSSGRGQRVVDGVLGPDVANCL